jgi:hypothetical protein
VETQKMPEQLEASCRKVNQLEAAVFLSRRDRNA